MGWIEFPEEIKERTYGANTYKYVGFTGEVIGANKWSDTYVSGHGDKHGTTVKSDVVHKTEFFLKDGDEEQSFQISDLNVPVREGQKVSVVWCILNDRDTGPHRFVFNHTTKDGAELKSAFKGLVGPTMGRWAILLLLIGLASLFGSGISAGKPNVKMAEIMFFVIVGLMFIAPAIGMFGKAMKNDKHRFAMEGEKEVFGFVSGI